MSRPTHTVLIGFTLLLALTGLAVAGCASSPSQVQAKQKAECFGNEQQIKLAIDLVNADTGIYPDVKDVVAKLHVACPSGGTYSFDPKTNTVTCSVHGHP